MLQLMRCDILSVLNDDEEYHRPTTGVGLVPIKMEEMLQVAVSICAVVAPTAHPKTSLKDADWCEPLMVRLKHSLEMVVCEFVPLSNRFLPTILASNTSKK